MKENYCTFSTAGLVVKMFPFSSNFIRRIYVIFCGFLVIMPLKLWLIKVNYTLKSFLKKIFYLFTFKKQGW